MSVSSPTSAKHIAVSRRVARVMDLDANGATMDMLRHTERVCPELQAAPGARPTEGSSDDDDEDGVSADYAALIGMGPASLSTTANIAQFAVRRPLEGCVTALHMEFLAKLREVRDNYRAVQSTVHELQREADNLKLQADTIAHKAEPLIAAVAVRREELKEARDRQLQLDSLLREYRVTDEESAILSSGVVDDDFLAAVDKVKRIHHSCRTLMLGAHQHAVVDVAETMYMTRLKATEVICQYLCAHLGPLLNTPIPAFPPLILRSLLSINDRPSHLGRVVGDIVTARRAVLATRFRELLHGLPRQHRDARGGGPAPLENIAASDPTRFCTELLSWLHQRAAEEDDLLQQFYPDADSAAYEGAPTATRAETVGDILDPLAQPIRARLEQLTMSIAKQAESALGARSAEVSAPPKGFSYGGAFSAAASMLFGGSGSAKPSAARPTWPVSAINNIVSLFRIDSILGYFGEARLAPLAGASSTIAEGIGSAKLSCLMLSYNVLRVAVDSVSDSRTAATLVSRALPRTTIDPQAIRGRWAPVSGVVTRPTRQEVMAAFHKLQADCDLSPPAGVDGLAQVVKGALEVVQNNQLLKSTDEKDREATPILGAVFDALVGMVAPISRDVATLSTLPAPLLVCELVKCVIRLNLVSKFRSLVAPFPFASRRAQQLAEDLAEEVTLYSLISTQYIDSRTGCAAALDGPQEGDVAAALQQSVRALHSLLAEQRAGGSPAAGEGRWLAPLASSINNSQVREASAGRVNSLVVAQYALLEARLRELPPSSPAQAALALVASYPPDQVGVLLGTPLTL